MKKKLILFSSICVLLACDREYEDQNKEQYYTQDGKVNNLSYRVIGSAGVNILNIYYYNGNNPEIKHVSGNFGNRWTSEVINGIKPEYIAITSATAISTTIPTTNGNIDNTLKCEILVNGKVVKRSKYSSGIGHIVTSIKW